MLEIKQIERPPWHRRMRSWLRHMTWRDLFWYVPRGYLLYWLYGKRYVTSFFGGVPPRTRRERLFRRRIEECAACFSAGYCLRCGCPNVVAVLLSGKRCKSDEEDGSDGRP